MQYDELDRILSEEETILPSSGFTASVMAAVAREGSAAAPIAFPWRRVVPGLLASGLAIAVLIQRILVQPGMTSARYRPEWLPALMQILETARHWGVHWIGFALLLAFASIRLATLLSMRGHITMAR